MDNTECSENTKCVVDVQFGEYVEFDHVPDAFETAKAIEMCLNAAMRSCLTGCSYPNVESPVQIIVKNKLGTLVDAARQEYSGVCGSPAMVNFMQLMRESNDPNSYTVGVKISATYLSLNEKLPEKRLQAGVTPEPLYRFKKSTEVEKV